MSNTLSVRSEGSRTSEVKTVQHLLKNESLKASLQKRLRPLMIPNYTNRCHTRSLDGARVLLYSQWNVQSPQQIPDLLRQREPLMSLLEGTSDRIETHLYDVAFTADAHGLLTSDNSQVPQSQALN